MSEFRSDRRQWRIQKEISVGDIIAFVVAAGAVATAYFTLDKRLTVVETLASESTRAGEVWRNEVRDELREIQRKMDKIIEIKGNHG